jgi:hypothetical protein
MHMTSQPDYAADRVGMEEDHLEAEYATEDPDLIVVAGEVIDEDDDPDTADGSDLAGKGLAADDLAGKGLAADDSDDLASDDLAADDLAADDLAADDLARSDSDAMNGGPVRLGPQWHDIQAMFVDDPRGSVELAAAAADAAVSALVEELQQRQSALAPTGGTSADRDSTEQLREALRGYRIFCEHLTEIGQRLV